MAGRNATEPRGTAPCSVAPFAVPDVRRPAEREDGRLAVGALVGLRQRAGRDPAMCMWMRFEPTLTAETRFLDREVYRREVDLRREISTAFER